jgi:hypothetical protein
MTARIAALARTSVPWRPAVLAGLLSLLLAAPLWLILGGGASPQQPLARTAAGRSTLSSLPLAAQGPVSATLGAADPAYRVGQVPGGLQSLSRAQGLRARFTSAGVLLASGSLQVSLSVRSVGYGASLLPVAEVAPRAAGNRVLYAHPGLSEWYANGPLGLEQGFTVPRPAEGQAAGALTIAMALSGDPHVSLADGGTRLLLSNGAHTVLQYGGLLATDARGHALRTWLQMRSGELLLRVDAHGASYPLSIDPLVAGEELNGKESAEGGYFGRSVALTPNGDTAVIGGSRDENNVGAAWVFTRSGSTWSQQGPKLTGGEEEIQGRFGASVALSADGNTAIIGGNTDDVGIGAAWVFTRSSGVWTQQGPKLTGGEEVGQGFFGRSVALSADGNTAIIGGNGDGEEAGAVWVFTRVGGVWMQQGPKLTGAGEAGAGQFGMSVALAADGSSALVGGPADGASGGAVWAFARSGGVWTQQGGKFTGGEEVGKGEFGESIALSADGGTAIVGGYRDGASGRGGAAWIFTRPAGAWTQDGAKLTGGPGSFFGYSVALSSTGEVALVGGPRDHGKEGAVWEFVESDGEWVSAGSKLIGTDAAETPSETSEEIEQGAFGRSIALSADGTRALIGAPRDFELSGVVWVFVQPPPLVVSSTPNGVGQATATFHGTVNPEGRTITDCHFEYGTAKYEASVPCATTPGAQSNPVPVAASVGDLQPGTTYRFRLVASNVAGTGFGGEWTFSTHVESGSGTPPGEKGTGTTPPAKETGTVEVSAFRAVSFGSGSGSGSGSGHGTTGSGATCVVSLASRAASVPGAKNVAVKLRSKGSFAGPCKGRLRLLVKTRAGSTARSTTIATGSFSIPAGRTRWVHIRLNAFGRTLLAGAHGQLNGTLSILSLSPGPARAATATVRLPRHVLSAAPKAP